MDRAHHFDPSDPERKHAASDATTAERTPEPGTQHEAPHDQHLTKAIRERHWTRSEEVGQQLSVTRERIRQIEAKAPGS